METNWAAEHLQTIRTLMERSAVYRRALAPILLVVGVLGIAAAAAGLLLHLDGTRAFIELWLTTAAAGVVCAFLIARQQALKDREAFWSPPTRRVAQALLPFLLAGLCFSVVLAVRNIAGGSAVSLVTLVWMVFYGCALHAAGFFMSRGIRLLGWIYILCGCGIYSACMLGWFSEYFNPHWLMGFFFGILQLACAAYLYATEKRKNAE